MIQKGIVAAFIAWDFGYEAEPLLGAFLRSGSLLLGVPMIRTIVYIGVYIGVPLSMETTISLCHDIDHAQYILRKFVLGPSL